MQRGFQIKVPPSGKAVYQVEARLGGTGKIKKFKIGNVQDIPLPEARDRAKEALDKIRSGIDPLLEKRALLHEGKTLRQLIDIYYESRNLKASTRNDYEYLATTLLKHWLDKRVTDITRHEIRDWYARGRKTPTHTEGGYRLLNSLMVFAMGLEIITQNPCQIVTNAGMRYRIQKRTKHIEVNLDLPKFLIAFTEYKYLRDSERVARDVILLILTTGLRSKEARTLQWKHVDMERKMFTIPDTKNRRDHVVPMTPLTYGMFRYRQQHSDKSKYVFRIRRKTKSGCITDFQKTLTNICNKAQISVVTAHDLRRTFATVLNSMNVGYADMKELMNHKTRDITAGVYIQPDLEKLRKILVPMVDYFDHKIPAFPPGQGVSRYGSGTLRYSLYKQGNIYPEELNDPTEEDPDWMNQAEREFWEG
jgi:integrase